MTSVKNLLEEAQRLLSEYSELEEIRGVQEEEQGAMEQFHRFQNLSNHHIDDLDQDFLRVYTEAIENGLPEDSDLKACREEIVVFLEDTKDKYADLIETKDRNEDEQSLFEIIADLKEIKRQGDY
tara:strand:+ start:58 stop:432 length:375 start_codon:yes stop_codon:yes gene_type:complete